ncbi:MAG TPA: LLM class flavin-dependent oxidoreductase [Methylomirabilota bacterium]|jgi:alkanesulfonate monooxygenase SsuD/methylene tetrahydromethanopterin reductase-like flavin-dependent oxidoreductase (luciferase family)|nr:LLM class flavin-dependent oxidoreductase [Methylomirabilota bacterium]
MQFGLFMMPLHPPHRAFADCYDRDIAQIVLADQLGFREAWVGEHLTERWENAPAPDLLLAQALALTKNVRLGTGVTLLALHNPVYLAHRLAMLDHMSRGRFQWGIGGGGIPTDLSLFGLDPSSVRARSAEVLDVVLKLWASEGRFTYRGKFFDIDTPVLDPVKGRGYYMKPLQQPHPPIAVAASTPDSSSMRMAGERGWIPMSSSLLSRSHLAAHWRLVESGAAGAGRRADRSNWRVARDVLVAPTSAMARERARAVLGRNYVEHQHPNRIGTVQMASTKLDPSIPDDAVTVDYLMENVWIVGDPAECTEKIHELYEVSGGFGALLSITTDSDDAGWDHESLRLLMEDVAPRVAHLG